MPSVRPPRSPTLAMRLAGFSGVARPAMRIDIDPPPGRPYDSYAPTFSTLDTITGTVAITAPATADVRFADIDLSFVGFTSTFVDKMSSTATVNSRSEASHQFLKLSQPNLNPSHFHHIPAGTTTTFPFTFVVPAFHLSCRHKVSSPTIRQAHSRLPPSLGDPDLAGTGATLLDDMAPTMARISYSVTVKLTNITPLGDKVTVLAEKSRKVRILPAVPEAPPTTPAEDDPDYCLRKEKSVRKSLLPGRRTGRLAVTTSSPPSFRLAHISATSAVSQADTLATLRLRFDPLTAEAQPPKLGQLTSKLRVVTFFGSAARHDLPCKNTVLYDSTQGSFHETIPLHSRSMGSVRWACHNPTAELVQVSSHKSMADATIRRDSVISICSLAATNAGHTLEPTSTYNPALPFYTADLLVPMRLPPNKAWIPSFHSCLASRVYILELNLAVDAPGMATTMPLRVPVHISSTGSARQADAGHIVDVDVDALGRNVNVGDACDEVALAMGLEALAAADVASPAHDDPCLPSHMPDSPPSYTPLPTPTCEREREHGFWDAARGLIAVAAVVR